MHALHTTAARVRRGEEGMTLVEMLVGMSAAMVVIFAAYGAISAATGMQTRTINRVDSAARGRTAMEVITRDIRAQQCVPTQAGLNSDSTPAMAWASGDFLQFYSSVAPAQAKPSDQAPPQMRRIEWKQTPVGSLNSADATAQPVGDIIESTWEPTTKTPPYTYPTKPTEVQTIATDVEHVRASNGTILPIFRYYGYTVVGGVGRPSDTPYPLVNAGADAMNPSNAASVATANLPKIVMVDIQFAARPRAQKVTESGVTSRPGSVVPLFNRVSVRTADPTDPGVSPLCM